MRALIQNNFNYQCFSLKFCQIFIFYYLSISTISATQGFTLAEVLLEASSSDEESRSDNIELVQLVSYGGSEIRTGDLFSTARQVQAWLVT